jgi:Putative lumazine-binding
MPTGYFAFVRRIAGILVAVLLAGAGAGCGAPSDEERVRATLDTFAEATAQRDWRRICDEVLARRLLDRLKAAGIGCEVALSTGLQGVRDPRLEIGAVTVRGDAASARVRTLAANQNESTDTVELVRQGEEWRIAALGG